MRRRTFFSLIIPVVFVFFARPKLTVLAAGMVVAIVGELIRIWAAGTISKNRELAHTGPFAHVRNPLYLGSLLIAVGYCLMSGLWWSWVATAILYYVFYFGTIFTEEAYLRENIGAPYEEYASAVPRIVPRLRPHRTGTPSAFQWRQVWYNREQWSIYGVVAFAAAFTLMYFRTAR